MIQFAKGTKVSWTLKDGETGTGTCVMDEAGGKVLVAVESKTSKFRFTTTQREMHYTIWCNTTWLTVVA